MSCLLVYFGYWLHCKDYMYAFAISQEIPDTSPNTEMDLFNILGYLWQVVNVTWYLA